MLNWNESLIPKSDWMSLGGHAVGNLMHSLQIGRTIGKDCWIQLVNQAHACEDGCVIRAGVNCNLDCEARVVPKKLSPWQP